MQFRSNAQGDLNVKNTTSHRSKLRGLPVVKSGVHRAQLLDSALCASRSAAVPVSGVGVVVVFMVWIVCLVCGAVRALLPSHPERRGDRRAITALGARR